MALSTTLTAADIDRLKQLRDAHYAKPYDHVPWMNYRDAVLEFADVLIEAAEIAVATDATIRWAPEESDEKSDSPKEPSPC